MLSESCLPDASCCQSTPLFVVSFLMKEFVNFLMLNDFPWWNGHLHPRVASQNFGTSRMDVEVVQLDQAGIDHYRRLTRDFMSRLDSLLQGVQSEWSAPTCWPRTADPERKTASHGFQWAGLVATECWPLYMGCVHGLETLMRIQMGSWGCWRGEGEGGRRTVSGDNKEEVCS